MSDGKETAKPILGYGRKPTYAQEWWSQGPIAYLSAIGAGLDFALVGSLVFFHERSWKTDALCLAAGGVFACWVPLAFVAAHRVGKARGETVANDLRTIRSWFKRE